MALMYSILYNKTALGWIINGLIVLILLTTAAFLGKGLKKLNLRQTVFLALLAALVSAIRAAIPIPDAKPTSYIIIATGVLMGPAAGFYLGLVITVVSSLFVGFGAFVPWQMLLWGYMGLTASFIKTKNRFILAGFGFVWGFVFGWVMDLWWPLSGFMPMTFASLTAGFASSFPFDLIHASMNFVLLLLLPPEMLGKLMNRLVTKDNKQITK